MMRWFTDFKGSRLRETDPPRFCDIGGKIGVSEFDISADQYEVELAAGADSEGWDYRKNFDEYSKKRVPESCGPEHFVRRRKWRAKRLTRSRSTPNIAAGNLQSNSSRNASAQSRPLAGRVNGRSIQPRGAPLRRAFTPTARSATTGGVVIPEPQPPTLESTRSQSGAIGAPVRSTNNSNNSSNGRSRSVTPSTNSRFQRLGPQRFASNVKATLSSPDIVTPQPQPPPGSPPPPPTRKTINGNNGAPLSPRRHKSRSPSPHPQRILKTETVAKSSESASKGFTQIRSHSQERPRLVQTATVRPIASRNRKPLTRVHRANSTPIEPPVQAQLPSGAKPQGVCPAVPPRRRFENTSPPNRRGLGKTGILMAQVEHLWRNTSKLLEELNIQVRDAAPPELPAEPCVVVFGPTSSGKSTLCNALLEEEVLPISIRECTRTIIKVTAQLIDRDYHELFVFRGEGAPEITKTQSITELRQWIARTQLDDQCNLVHIALRCSNDSKFLKSGITLVDCPGIGTNDEHDAIALNLVRSSMAVVFVVKATEPLGLTSSRCIRQIDATLKAQSRFTSLRFVLTKMDEIDDYTIAPSDMYLSEPQPSKRKQLVQQKPTKDALTRRNREFVTRLRLTEIAHELSNGQEPIVHPLSLRWWTFREQFGEDEVHRKWRNDVLQFQETLTIDFQSVFAASMAQPVEELKQWLEVWIERLSNQSEQAQLFRDLQRNLNVWGEHLSQTVEAIVAKTRFELDAFASLDFSQDDEILSSAVLVGGPNAKANCIKNVEFIIADRLRALLRRIHAQGMEQLADQVQPEKRDDFEGHLKQAVEVAAKPDVNMSVFNVGSRKQTAPAWPVKALRGIGKVLGFVVSQRFSIADGIVGTESSWEGAGVVGSPQWNAAYAQVVVKSIKQDVILKAMRHSCEAVREAFLKRVQTQMDNISQVTNVAIRPDRLSRLCAVLLRLCAAWTQFLHGDLKFDQQSAAWRFSNSATTSGVPLNVSVFPLRKDGVALNDVAHEYWRLASTLITCQLLVGISIPESEPYIAFACTAPPSMPARYLTHDALLADLSPDPFHGVLANPKFQKSLQDCIPELAAVVGIDAGHLLSEVDRFRALCQQRERSVAFMQKNNLEVDDCACIMLYTCEATPVYRDLNEFLRSPNRTVMFDKLQGFGAYLRRLIVALKKCPRFSGWAYRGVPCLVDRVQIYQPNANISWFAFGSLSLNRSLAETASARENSSGQTMFAIKAIESFQVAPISMFPEEEEVIMLPASMFRCVRAVMTIREDGTTRVDVDLEQIPSRVSLVG
eukprot:c6626_g1_i1.p1 GENE.c6626_g1_i1~~c6626_g1_i1.p1  ORF type:complete len:1397 (-),score=333.54 c6626_g1_i1:108-3986(-)